VNRFPIEDLFSSWYSPTFSTLNCNTMVGSNLLPLYLSEQIYWKSPCFLHLDSISGNNFCGPSDIVAEYRCMQMNIEMHLASWPNLSAFYVTAFDITMSPTLNRIHFHITQDAKISTSKGSEISNFSKDIWFKIELMFGISRDNEQIYDNLRNSHES